MAEYSSCDSCTYYLYDEEMDEYYCDKDLDEDDMYHYMTGNYKACPFYLSDNEYQIVKHQM